MWEKLGFDVVQSKDVIATLRVAGKFILKTKRSHGARKLDGEIPRLIRQQMRLGQAEFDAAYDCPLTRNDYVEILRKKGVIP